MGLGRFSKQHCHVDGLTIPCGKTGKPWYFLEEMYPAFGNLVPRDIGSREVLRICEMGMGIDGQMQVYLDVSHLSEEKTKTGIGPGHLPKIHRGRSRAKCP